MKRLKKKSYAALAVMATVYRVLGVLALVATTLMIVVTAGLSRFNIAILLESLISYGIPGVITGFGLLAVGELFSWLIDVAGTLSEINNKLERPLSVSMSESSPAHLHGPGPDDPEHFSSTETSQTWDQFYDGVEDEEPFADSQVVEPQPDDPEPDEEAKTDPREQLRIAGEIYKAGEREQAIVLMRDLVEKHPDTKAGQTALRNLKRMGKE